MGASEGVAGRERERGRGRGGLLAGDNPESPTISLGCRPVAAHAVRNLVGDFNCVKADFLGEANERSARFSGLNRHHSQAAGAFITERIVLHADKSL